MSNHTITDFSFIGDDQTRSMVTNGYTAVTQLEAWSWLSTYRAKKGFMFSDHPNITVIGDLMEALPNPPGHSGASFGITMRHLEFIAKNGAEAYKKQMTKN
jgi:hypothetical protein